MAVHRLLTLAALLLRNSSRLALASAIAGSLLFSISALTQTRVGPLSIQNNLSEIIPTLPTTLPGTHGKLWNNGGVLCIS